MKKYGENHSEDKFNFIPDDVIQRTRTRNINISQSSKLEGLILSRILIVEDEVKLQAHIVQSLNDEGFSTFTCSSYNELEKIIQLPTKRFNVIILDRLLNGKDSATLLPFIKDLLPESKVLILSAIDSSSEKANLLYLGADDYMAKPFGFDELIARIKVLLRKNRPEIRFGNLVLDLERRTFLINGDEIPLQNKEFILLSTLIKNPGKVFNKNFLYEHVWEMNPEVESNAIEATVNKLRRRLEEVGANIKIKSMRNKGYWIEE